MFVFKTNIYLLINLPRCDASIVLHVESRSKAFLAALTAKSTSALSASATSASGFPVTGFKVTNFLPDCEFINSLFINS